jgi:hypothetical protein
MRFLGCIFAFASSCKLTFKSTTIIVHRYLLCNSSESCVLGLRDLQQVLHYPRHPTHAMLYLLSTCRKQRLTCALHGVSTNPQPLVPQALLLTSLQRSSNCGTMASFCNKNMLTTAPSRLSKASSSTVWHLHRIPNPQVWPHPQRTAGMYTYHQVVVVGHAVT